MRWSVRCAILLFVLCVANQAFAGSPGRLGTAGAQELRIPVGSRTMAMGGAAIADVSGTEALFWNPAGAASPSGTEAVFSYLRYIADIKLSYFGITTNLGDVGSLGASAKVLDIGDIPVTTEEYPEGTGATYSPTFFVVGLTYSRRMTDRVSFGATGMYIHEKIMRETASGLAFDFGFQYATGIPGLKFGIVMKNYGPNMRFDGADFEYFQRPTEDDPQAIKKAMRLRSTSFELPSSIQFGTSYEMGLSNSRLTFTGNFQSNSFSEDEFRGGVEYAFGEMFFLRAGYIQSDQSGYLYDKATFGGGICLPIGGSNITLDYSYVPTEFFDDNQWFTLKLGF